MHGKNGIVNICGVAAESAYVNVTAAPVSGVIVIGPILPVPAALTSKPQIKVVLLAAPGSDAVTAPVVPVPAATTVPDTLYVPAGTQPAAVCTQTHIGVCATAGVAQNSATATAMMLFHMASSSR